MTTFYIKLLDTSKNVLLQSILGTYSHLMWVRTENPENGIVRISTTEDLLEDTVQVLNSIKDEIGFEYL